MPSSPTPGKQCSTCHTHCIIETSAYLTASSFPFTVFEAQSVQLTLTACCIDPPVLNLWDYSRRPRVLYPVAGLPFRNGTSTRWNIRPCPAALGLSKLNRNLRSPTYAAIFLFSGRVKISSRLNVITVKKYVPPFVRARRYRILGYQNCRFEDDWFSPARVK